MKQQKQPKQPKPPSIPFTGQERLVIFLLAATSFTVVVDFMVMNPLSALLMKAMTLTNKQFAACVSAYALCAGLSGLLTAGFADKFDRKKLLLFFYAGFTLGTIFCGVANSYHLLLAARVITGIFGGVIGSISMAIITDLFAAHQRGRVMGFVQMGFGASQVLGVPIGLYLANHFGWQFPFYMVAAFAVIIIVLVVAKLPAVTAHLAAPRQHNALQHLWKTVSKKDYRIVFTATCLLAVGGYMMMPFGANFAQFNLGVTENQYALLIFISGLASLFIMPMAGKLSDKMDRYTLFLIATFWMMGIVVFYTHLGHTPIWEVAIINILMFVGIMGRMVPSMAMATSIPDMQDRGAFMSINSSMQQISGGIAAIAAGRIIYQQTPTSVVQHYDILGYTMVGISSIALILMYRVSVLAKKKQGSQAPPPTPKGEDLLETILEA